VGRLSQPSSAVSDGLLAATSSYHPEPIPTRPSWPIVIDKPKKGGETDRELAPILEGACAT